jgi:hypothetical protein
MKKTFYLLPLIAICLLNSCIEQAYLSPFNANSNPYHAIPLQSDSIRGATYISSVFTIGAANQDWLDNVFAFRLGLHRSHTFGNFHLYYGGNVAAGIYNISSSNFDDLTMNGAQVNQYAGSKFFGGYGFNGGFNVLLPIHNGGEWRVIGLEGSAQNEFGDYMNFRKNLSDSVASIITKNNWTGTVGVTSEIITKRRSGTEFGYKLGIGTGLNTLKNYYSHYTEVPIYVSNTLHFTKDNFTAFWQINLGSYAGSFQMGINYRFGKK